MVGMAVKSTEAEVASRVEDISALILDGASRTEICEYVRKKWEVSSSQADRYVQKAREEIRKRCEGDGAKRLALSQARHERVYEAAMGKGDYSTAERTLRDMDDIEGLKGGSACIPTEALDDANDFWDAMSAYGSAIRDTCSPEQISAIVTKANALGAAFNIGNVPKAHPIDPNAERVLEQAVIDMKELGRARTREELIEAGVIDPVKSDLPPGFK